MGTAEIPETPPGWETYGNALIRLADPDGGAAAWIAPGYGANCVAFMVHAADDWMNLLHNDGPQALAERPSRYGCPVLFPFPGHMRDFRYAWRGETLIIPRRSSAAPSFTHGFAHTHAWRMTDVAPNRVTMSFSTSDDLAPDERTGYPFAVHLTQTMTLAGNTLRIELHATNEGARPAPVGLGLHPYFAVAALGGDRAQVQVNIPGRLERHLRTPADPASEKRPVTIPTVTAPPMGETALIARTALDRHARATLNGPSGDWAIALTFIEGVRDVVYFVPPDQPSLSVEPRSCASSATSRPEGDPDGLVPLAPGASIAMIVEIGLTAHAGGL